jgi:hypothetical protein
MTRHSQQLALGFGKVLMALRHGIQSLLTVGLVLGGLACQQDPSISDREDHEVREPAKVLAAKGTERKSVFAAEIASQMSEPLGFNFDFDVSDVAGRRVTKADSAGRVLIVNICATWVPECVNDVSNLSQLYSRFHDQGLEIIGFYRETFDSATDVDRNNVLDFCNRHQVPYSSALLLPDVGNQAPDINLIPTTLFFDRKGKPRLVIAGLIAPLKLEAIVERLLSE